MAFLDKKVENSNVFLREISSMKKACVGVVLIRTSEPYRAISSLRDQCIANTLPFKFWDAVHGWHNINTDNKEELDLEVVGIPGDGTNDPNGALRAIEGLVGTAANRDNISGFPEGGIYAMQGVNFWIGDKPNFLILQCLREYSELLPKKSKMLALTVPPGFTPNPIIENDVIIIDFDLPSYSELKATYTDFISSVEDDQANAHIVPKITDEEVGQLVTCGMGMTINEFETSLARTLVDVNDGTAGYDAFAEKMLGFKTETIKRSEVLELMSSRSMDEVGGLDLLKEWVRRRSYCFTDKAAEFGVDTPKGIALVGPPGVGKSLIACAISKNLKLPLIRFDISRCFNSLVGSSEERIRTALKQIEAQAPCVVFIDEADKVFDSRSGGGDSGVGKRILGTLLTWMQETKAPVFIVVTANSVEGMPAEFLRKGRLDEVFSVTVPNEEERMEVLRIHLQKRGKNPDEVRNLQYAVDKSNGFVPAEIEAAVKEAIVDAYVAKEERGESGELTGEIIAEQLESMNKLSEAFKDKFDAMQKWAEDNARPASKSVAKTRSRTDGIKRTRRIAPKTANLDG